MYRSISFYLFLSDVYVFCASLAKKEKKKEYLSVKEHLDFNERLKKVHKGKFFHKVYLLSSFGRGLYRAKFRVILANFVVNLVFFDEIPDDAVNKFHRTF